MNIFYQGETKALYASFTSPATITVSSATFALYADTVEQPGYPVVCTGIDAPGTSVRAWYVLNSEGLDVGDYEGVFTATVIGSDGITRTVMEPVQFSVMNPAQGI